MAPEKEEIIRQNIDYCLPRLVEQLEASLNSVAAADQEQMIEAELEKVRGHMVNEDMYPAFAFPLFNTQTGGEYTILAGGALTEQRKGGNDLAKVKCKLANSQWGASELSESDFDKYVLLKILEAYETHLQGRLKFSELPVWVKVLLRQEGVSEDELATLRGVDCGFDKWLLDQHPYYWVDTVNRSGLHWVRHDGVLRVHYRSEEDYKKIKKAKEEIWRQQIKRFLEPMKEDFLERLKRSREKQTLIEQEIEITRRHISGTNQSEVFALAGQWFSFNSTLVKGGKQTHLAAYYQKWIVSGEEDEMDYVGPKDEEIYDKCRPQIGAYVFANYLSFLEKAPITQQRFGERLGKEISHLLELDVKRIRENLADQLKRTTREEVERWVRTENQKHVDYLSNDGYTRVRRDLLHSEERALLAAKDLAGLINMSEDGAVNWLNEFDFARMLFSGIDYLPNGIEHLKGWKYTGTFKATREALKHHVAVLEYTNFLTTPVNVGERVASKTLALYCFYRESQGEYPELEGLTRKAKNEKIAFQYGLSYNAFRQDVSLMQKREERLSDNNLFRYSQVLEMLADFPKAKKMAEDELKILENRRG